MTGLYDIAKTILKTKTYLEAGLQENLELTEVVYKPTETSEFLAFYFINEDGTKTLSHTEWPKKMKKPINELNDSEKEIYISLINRQKKLVHQIVSAILGQDISLTGNSFKEFAQNTVKALEGKFSGKKVRAKVVYDYRGFTSLANNPDFRFIEPMSVEKSEIQILDTDKLTRTDTRNDRRSQTSATDLGISTDEDPSTNMDSDNPF